LRTFFIENFGCRASQADGAAIESLLKIRGLSAAKQPDSAEIVILNTCTVTATADADVRSAIRQAHQANPEARILVTGCYAQRDPQAIALLPGVEWVVGNSHKEQIGEILEESPYHSLGGVVRVGDIFETKGLMTAGVMDATADRARPNLKVQDGCNNRCSFCIIPFVRGRSRFVSGDEIVDQVRLLAKRYREVVLTGINLGRWGREAGSQMRLPDLLRRLLGETGIERIRLSSIEPMDWSDAMIELMASTERIARHVHMPLQSGSDSILRKMHRKYRPRHYAERLRKAYAAMPDAAIGADVMTGFPGETEANFEESVAFIEALPFTYLHVFTYSERPGTPAASLPGSVPVSVRRERTRRLRELSERRTREFRRRMLGRTLEAVTLEKPGLALTSNYIPVEVADWRFANRMIEVTPVGLTANGMCEQGVLRILPVA
jgi:threonylcarbamoyladenosine tRNA methylthiotransferase MtaB